MRASKVLILDRKDLGEEFRTISFKDITSESVFNFEVQEKAKGFDVTVYKDNDGEKVIKCIII